MASSYEFKNLEQEAKKLETKLDTFISKEDSLKNKIKNLKWDSKKYDSKNVEKRINDFLKDAKNKINRITNSAYDTLKKTYSSSLAIIRSEAQKVNSEIDYNNSLVSFINFINVSFSNKKFNDIIELKYSFNNDVNSQLVKNYYLLVKVKSYEALCNTLKNNVIVNNAEIFINYYFFCKNNNATNHLKSASLSYFNYIYDVFKDHQNEIPSEKVYLWAKIALNCSSEIVGIDSQKVSLIYEIFKDAFNNETNKAFESFNYSALKALAYDSNFMKKEDIVLNVLKSQEFNDNDRICFISEKGKLSDGKNLIDAINDNESLLTSNKRNDYLKALLPCLNKENFVAFDTILSQLKNDFSFGELLYLSDILFNDLNMELLGDKLILFYCEMILDNRNSVPLLATVNLLVTVSSSYTINDSSIKNMFNDISFTLIKGNMKTLASLDDKLKKQINDLYDSCSLAIIGKKPKKNLSNVKKPIPLNRNFKVAIRKIQSEKTLKNKKFMVAGCVILGIIIVGLIILLVLFL